MNRDAYEWLETYEVRERADTGTDIVHYPCGSAVTELDNGDNVASFVELIAQHDRECTA